MYPLRTLDFSKEHLSIRLVTAESQDHWLQARLLVEAYAASLDVDLSFQDFGYEVENLAAEYAAPNGTFLMAEEGGIHVGCIGLRRFAAGVGEIKRLYVSPGGRGRGVGRMLVEGVMAAGRRLGYARLVLDTLPSMKEAQKLYASFGFTPTAPYRFNPVPGSAYLEKLLS
jgi:GNAT superfamily N-acetyltransferase